MKIRIRYVVKENRQTDYYDVGENWILNFPSKRKLCKIVWNKWFFGRRIVLLVFKPIKSE